MPKKRPLNTGSFKPGDPRAGRPKGTRNKVTKEAKAVCLAMVTDEAYLRNLQARLKSRRLAPALESMLWHYAFGKPIDRHELTGQDGKPIETRDVSMDEMSTEDLLVLAQQQLATDA